MGDMLPSGMITLVVMLLVAAAIQACDAIRGSVLRVCSYQFCFMEINSHGH